jgi:CheY-like chemotaxis protein/HPt (histidine-containing phosphotransfer) domain-containing protein
LRIIRSEALAKGIELELNVGEDVPQVVLGDPTRLRQILLNLVGNAVKFTPSGRIGVALRREPSTSRIRFEITDTGIGIPFEQQHRLFGEFVQVRTSTSRLYGGTGLGLAISQRLVEAMGGMIGVSSMPGHGSTFWFTVSLPTAVAEVEAVDGGGRTQRRILVVDDNSVNRMVVQALLKQDGHQVVLAADGAQALEAVRSSEFDLVLMDLQMPVMNGEAATRAIRQLEDDPPRSIPIIALTANSMPADVQRCRAAGMNDHLSKPINRELLRVAVEAWTILETDRPRVAVGPVTIDPTKDNTRLAAGRLLELDSTVLLESFDGDHAMVHTVLKTAIASIKADMQCVEDGLEAQDAQRVLEAAHRIKGTSGDLRANRLRDIISVIERTPREHSWIIAPALLAELESAVDALSRDIAAYIR